MEGITLPGLAAQALTPRWHSPSDASTSSSSKHPQIQPPNSVGVTQAPRRRQAVPLTSFLFFHFLALTIKAKPYIFTEKQSVTVLILTELLKPKADLKSVHVKNTADIPS